MIGSGISSVGLVRGVPEHHPLVARAEQIERIAFAALRLVRLVDALRDVGRLLVERDDHAGRVGIEAELRARVPDLAHALAHEARNVDVALRRDLAGDDDEAGRDQGLAGDASVRVVAEDGVEDGIRDLVGHLVGMTLGDRLGSEGKRAIRHRARLANLTHVTHVPMRAVRRSCRVEHPP